MEPLSFACPKCSTILEYDRDQVGLPYQCPGCMSKGKLPKPPPITEDDELYLDDKSAKRKKARKQRKMWEKAQFGMLFIALGWAGLTLLTLLVAVGLCYEWMRIIFLFNSPPLALGYFGVLGIIGFVVEMVALFGYFTCLNAPPQGNVRVWTWVALGLAVVRNLMCLAGSIVYLVANRQDHALGIRLVTVFGMFLFFAQWVIGSVMLGAFAAVKKEGWVGRLIRYEMTFLFTALAFWVFQGIGTLAMFGSLEPGRIEMSESAQAASLFPRLMCGTSGVLLSLAMVAAMALHLRVIYYTRAILHLGEA